MFEEVFNYNLRIKLDYSECKDYFNIYLEI